MINVDISILISKTKEDFNKEIYSLQVNKAEIISSPDNLTDTCKITIPRKNTFIENGNILTFVNKTSEDESENIILDRGYYIFVNFNYSEFPDDRVTFTGYVVDFKELEHTVIINCEDEMWLLKNAPRVKNNWSKDDKLFLHTDDATETSFLDEIIPDKIKPFGLPSAPEKIVNYSNDTIRKQSLGIFQIKDYVSPSEMLSILKENYFIYPFFREHEGEQVLYCGWKYWNKFYLNQSDNKKYSIDGYSKTHKFAYPYYDDYNYVIKNDLDYQTFNKLDMLVIVNGITPDGDSINYYYAEDEDGQISSDKLKDNVSEFDDTRNINLGSGQSLDDLKQMAQQVYKRVKGKGFTGSFTTFGYPKVRHGDIVQFKMNTSRVEDEEKIWEKQYLVAAVTTTFTIDGGVKQKIELDQEVS